MQLRSSNPRNAKLRRPGYHVTELRLVRKDYAKVQHALFVRRANFLGTFLQCQLQAEEPDIAPFRSLSTQATAECT